MKATTTTSVTDSLSMDPGAPRRVLISYSHDSPAHSAAVLELAHRLREAGLDAWVDQFEDPPTESWPDWTREQLMGVCFVLVVCTEEYRRQFEGQARSPGDPNATWEGFITEQMLYQDDARNLRFIPVFLDEPNKAHVPLALHATTFYSLPADFPKLQRRLTHQPPMAPAKVGQPATPGSEGDRELALLRETAKAQLLAGRNTSRIDERILVRRRQLREDEVDLGVGSRLNNQFELVQPIGSDATSSVWRAYDLRREHIVAVKLLNHQFIEDPARVERFFRSARDMARLSHPGVVRVLDAQKVDGQAHYYVMEHVRGESLEQRVKAGTWHTERTKPTLLDLADALQAAHESNLAHWDVKPANILLAEDGTTKLSDYNLGHAPVTSVASEADAARGASPYTAPELREAPGQADCGADIYSLSMVGVFALYGRDIPGDAAHNPITIIDRLDTSLAFKEVLEKGCAQTRAIRYGGILEFADALRRASTRPDSTRAPTRQGAPQRPAAASTRHDASGAREDYRSPSSHSAIHTWGATGRPPRSSFAPPGSRSATPAVLAALSSILFAFYVPLPNDNALAGEAAPTGTLSVEGAGRLFIDNRASGELPFVGDLPAGKHVLRVERDLYGTFEREVSLSPGKPLDVTPTFHGMVTLLAGKNTDHDVFIRLDGNTVLEPCRANAACPTWSSFPFAIPLRETHRITVSRAGYRTFEKVTYLAQADADYELRVVVDLEPLELGVLAPSAMAATAATTGR